MMCQRLAVMYAGKIMEMGETPAIFENPVHPYTRFLLSAIPIIGKKAGSGEEISVSGEPPNPEDFPPGCRFHPRCPHATDLCRKDAPELRRLEENRWIACHRDL
ncbi:MAG: ABC transporter ATP-binding protein [Deltaproteobacteria bacterium]|nr:ABC transporter ATP-binding protein [Deltaproteobacteria bacterium]